MKRQSTIYRQLNFPQLSMADVQVLLDSFASPVFAFEIYPSARLPFGFVCVACTAGNLKQAIGKERLRQIATAFAAVRLPDREQFCLSSCPPQRFGSGDSTGYFMIALFSLLVGTS